MPANRLWLPIAAATLATLTALPLSAAEADAAGSLPAPREERFHQDVAWSPDGEWLAFTEHDGAGGRSPESWGVYLVRADGTGRRLLVSNAIYVTWSPDGKRLAFGSSRDGDWEIYTIGADGSGLERLTHDPAKDNLPAWSPRGDRIAFCSDRDGDVEVYTVAPDGSALTRLTHDPAEDFNPAWSPDGESLVFFRELGDRKDQIWRIRADGSGEQRVTHGEAHNIFPSVLPDGRVGFSSTGDDGVRGLVTVAPDGSDRRRVGTVDTFFARWSPDGETIAFIGGKWPSTAIYLMNADGSGVRKIVN